MFSLCRVSAIFCGMICAFAALLDGGTAVAAPSACKPYTSAITLDFKTKMPAPIYNNRLSIAGIRNLFATRGETLAGPHRRALGITYIQSELSMQGATVAKPSGNGYCVYLTKVDAEFGWERMEVYVASEFQPGTCEYRAVLDHENQHVAIDRGAVQDTAPQLRARLEAVLQQQQPVYVANGQAGADAAVDAVYKRMESQLSAFQKQLDERNGVIDTDSNYDATAQLCPGFSRPQPKPQ